MTPPPSEPPRERRKDFALRALYLRVDTLEKVIADLTSQLTVLEAGAVTFKWLFGVILGLFIASFVGAMTVIGKANDVAAASEARNAESNKALAKTVERVVEDQTDIKVWAKALYLVNVERQPRETAKQEASKEKEK